MVKLHGVFNVRVPTVLKFDATVAQFTNKVNPEETTQVKPTDCPGTKGLVVSLKENLPILAVAPGAIAGAKQVRLLYIALPVCNCNFVANVGLDVKTGVAEGGKLSGKSEPPTYPQPTLSAVETSILVEYDSLITAACQ